MAGATQLARGTERRMRSDREKDYPSDRETKTHAAATYIRTRVRTRIFTPRLLARLLLDLYRYVPVALLQPPSNRACFTGHGCVLHEQISTIGVCRSDEFDSAFPSEFFKGTTEG